MLLQVVFHARVAAERTDGTGFTIDDVADGIVAKLVRRHPHVFADVRVSGADEVKQQLGRHQGRRAGRAPGGGPPRSVVDGRAVGPARAAAGRAAAAPGRAGRRCPPRRPDLPPGTRPADGQASATSAPSCSRWWPGPARPASTPNSSSAPPPAPTATRSVPGNVRARLAPAAAALPPRPVRRSGLSRIGRHDCTGSWRDVQDCGVGPPVRAVPASAGRCRSGTARLGS